MVIKLSLLGNFTSLSAESYELSVLCERENQIGSDNELEYRFGVSLVHCVSMHFIPGDDLICLSQRRVYQACR